MTKQQTLLERLHSMHSDPIGCGLARQWHVNPDGPEAADEIARLQAEVERLTKLLAERDAMKSQIVRTALSSSRGS